MAEASSTISTTPKSFVTALTDNSILKSMGDFITVHKDKPLNKEAYYAILQYLSDKLYSIASTYKLRFPIKKVEKLPSNQNEDNIQLFNTYFNYFEKILIVITFNDKQYSEFKKMVDNAKIKDIVNYDHYKGSLQKLISRLDKNTRDSNPPYKDISIDTIVLNIYDLCVLINNTIFSDDINKMIRSIHLMNSINLFEDEDKKYYVKIKDDTSQLNPNVAAAAVEVNGGKRRTRRHKKANRRKTRARKMHK